MKPFPFNSFFFLSTWEMLPAILSVTVKPEFRPIPRRCIFHFLKLKLWAHWSWQLRRIFWEKLVFRFLLFQFTWNIMKTVRILKTYFGRCFQWKFLPFEFLCIIGATLACASAPFQGANFESPGEMPRTSQHVMKSFAINQLVSGKLCVGMWNHQHLFVTFFLGICGWCCVQGVSI